MNLSSRSRRFAVLAPLGLALALPGVAAAERPDASFTYRPDDPKAGQQVRFVSSSCDPDGRLTRQAWDLDGDGAYDDAVGREAARTYPVPGPREVGLQVTARGGQTDTQRRSLIIDSEYALPRTDAARLMSPFPVVRLAGRLTSSGARVKLFAVRGPVCSRVRVSCAGRSCPVRGQSKFMPRGRLRFPRFQRRLNAGTVLAVRISKADLIGKITRFRIREGMEPKRRDQCLRPGRKKGSRCPED